MAPTATCRSAPEFTGDLLHLAATSALIDAGDPSLLDPDGWPAWWLPGAWDAATSPAFDCDDADAAVYPGAGC